MRRNLLRVLCWDSGESEEQAVVESLSRPSSASFLAEGEASEFENRIDLANGSKPAIGLMAEPRGVRSCIGKVLVSNSKDKRHNPDQTPWEGKEYWQTKKR